MINCKLRRGLVLTLIIASFVSLDAGAQIGGQVYSTGDEVIIEVLPASAGYTSELRLFSPGPETPIALNNETGKVVNLGTFPVGVELIFGIYVQNTGDTFLMGPASRNPDNEIHAEVTETSPEVYRVGFEDLFGGGDRDYDDNLFQFLGVESGEGVSFEAARPVPALNVWGVILASLLLGATAIVALRPRG